MSWDDWEDEMTIPCPMCFEVYECAPDCDEIARAWIEEDEAKEKQMTKTLAAMTAEERKECVGMWCEVMVKTQIGVSTSPREPRLGILASLDWNGFWGRGGGFDFAGHVSPEMWENATPRFDLPRAWNADGTPVEMHIETDHVEYGRVEGGGIERVSFPDGTKVRRLVGEWEETND